MTHTTITRTATATKRKPKSKRKNGPVSPKVTRASMASAFATIVWILAGALAPSVFPTAYVTALIGATTTILVFLGGYKAHDPLRARE